MADYGVTKYGFKRKPYTVILEDKQARARAFFGEDIDLSDRSPLGLFIQVIAWEESKLWEVAEDVYYSAYIDDAEGKQLDSAVKYAARDRKGAQPAKAIVVIKGKKGTKITQNNLIVGTKADINFRPTETVNIKADPTEVEVVCLKPGVAGNVPANSITEIVMQSGDVNIDSVNNPEPAKGGQEVESDAELRERYYRSLASGGGSTAAAIEAALLSLPTVKDAFVAENDTNIEKNGLPPNCVAPFVFGGNDEEIAKTVLENKAGGIRSYGQIEVTVKDNRGVEQVIGFTRPVEKTIYIRLHVDKGEEFPVDGNEQIITAVLKYIGGKDLDGTSYKGLGLGENVVVSQIITAANIKGVDDVTVELSTDGESYAPENIVLDKSEIAITSSDKVVIL